VRHSLRRLASRWAVDDGSTPARSSAVEQRTGGRRLRRLWDRLDPYIGPSRGLVVLLAVVSLAAGFAEAGLIYLLVRIAAELADSAGSLDLSIGPLSADLDLVEMFAGATAALVLTILMNLTAAVLTTRLSVASLNRARKQTMEAFLDAGWTVQSRERPGWLQELLSTHVNKISQAVLAISTGLNAGLGFVALMVSAILVQPLAAGSILVGVVLVAALLRPLSRMTKQRSNDQKELNADYAMHVAETVSIAREINVFGVWPDVQRQMERHADRVARAQFATRLLVRASPVVYQSAVMGLLLAGMVLVRAASASEVTNIGAVVILLVRGLSYTQQINGAFQQASEITPYIEEVAAQEAHYRSQPVLGGSDVLGRVDHIELDSISFAYEPDRLVLEDVSLTIERGEVIGIVGPSGSGKSTLVQLLLRLRQPTAGRHLINGVDASAFDRRSWTSAVALVPQDNHLVRGTVADNVAFSRPEVGPSEVARAVTLAHLDDDVRLMADGLETEIGPGAADLSGGQRQRLGLARALAGMPEVIILDEPTSALDMRSETLIQETLEELRGSLTMFLVAHRLTTLSVCDRIVVLQAGRVSAVGTYDELLQSSEFFRDAVSLSRLPA
jgi:ATP-binding cassette subfamily B protein